MANFNTTQLANMITDPVTPLKPNERLGRARVAYFTWTSPAGVLIADTLTLCRLPLGARLLTGHLIFGAFGASATASVGVSGTSAKYKALTSIAAAGSLDFATTIAENAYDEMTAVTDLIATFAGANPAAGIVLAGHVLFAVD